MNPWVILLIAETIGITVIVVILILAWRER